MYRFKYYYLYGKEELSEIAMNSPRELIVVFKKVMDENQYNDFVNTNPTIQQILKKALRIFKSYLKDEYYKIAIINDTTNEVIDYMQIGNEHLVYRYKFIYNDGNFKLSGCRASNPKDLWFDFDGLMDWDEYDKLKNKDLKISEILNLAYNIYKKNYGNYYRLEIINDKTNEILDFIEESEMKKNG